MRAKKKRKDGDSEGGGDEGLSIHPGPGELVHQGLRLLVAQILPGKQI